MSIDIISVKSNIQEVFWEGKKRGEKKFPCNNKTCHDSLEIGKQ